MENFTTGYCHDLSEKCNYETELTSTGIPLSVDGVDVSNSFIITCPYCGWNIVYLTTVDNNYDTKCHKCGEDFKGVTVWGTNNGSKV